MSDYIDNDTIEIDETQDDKRPLLFTDCCYHHASHGGSCLDDDDYQQWVDDVDYWQSERAYMVMGG